MSNLTGSVDNYMIRSGRIELCKQLGISESSSYGLISERIKNIKDALYLVVDAIDNQDHCDQGRCSSILNDNYDNIKSLIINT